jgi:hypothetical protein
MATRGSITIGSTNTVLSVQEEEVALIGGVSNLNLPFMASENTFAAAIKGRVRNITIKGQYAGTQAQIEAFIKILDDWANADLSLQSTAKYYAMLNKSNDPINGAGNNVQLSYFNVLGRDFIYKYDNQEPTRITYTLSLIEGSKIGPLSSTAGGA